MSVESSASYQLARRAYELGRLRAGMLKAALMLVPLGIFGVATSGKTALFVLPLTFGAWVLAHWRGHVFLRGALYGLLGGILTSVLPMSNLRPCCAAGGPAPGMECCTMPGACLGAGALLGHLLAALVPFGNAAWWRTGTGVVVGMGSVAVFKCATLFAGEAVGLASGLMAGLAAATAARMVARRRWVS